MFARFSGHGNSIYNIIPLLKKENVLCYKTYPHSSKLILQWWKVGSVQMRNLFIKGGMNNNNNDDSKKMLLYTVTHIDVNVSEHCILFILFFYFFLKIIVVRLDVVSKIDIYCQVL